MTDAYNAEREAGLKRHEWKLPAANWLRDQINETLSRYDVHPDVYERDVLIDALCVVAVDKIIALLDAPAPAGVTVQQTFSYKELYEAAKRDAEEAEAYAKELEAKVKNLTKHHANMADPRYWEGRYRDENAKLAKAVEALEFYATQDVTYPNVGTVTFHGHDDNGQKARTTLAELKGEKDDSCPEASSF